MIKIECTWATKTALLAHSVPWSNSVTRGSVAQILRSKTRQHMCPLVHRAWTHLWTRTLRIFQRFHHLSSSHYHSRERAYFVAVDKGQWRWHREGKAPFRNIQSDYLLTPACKQLSWTPSTAMWWVPWEDYARHWLGRNSCSFDVHGIWRMRLFRPGAWGCARGYSQCVREAWNFGAHTDFGAPLWNRHFHCVGPRICRSCDWSDRYTQACKTPPV